MAGTTWVQVVGFSDAERHTINTVFRVSSTSPTNYALWKPELAAVPNVALIDLDSYEGGLLIGSPGWNSNLKVIGVGSSENHPVWRNFPRPVDWTGLLQVLDGLFAPKPELDFDLGGDDASEKTVPPGVKVAMLVGMAREERLYLRARLSLAGVTEVDEADTVGDASSRLLLRPYELVLISLELSDADPWGLVQSLKDLPSPTRSIIVVTHTPSWGVMERAEQMGCSGLLEIPFLPQQVLKLFTKV